MVLLFLTRKARLADTSSRRLNYSQEGCEAVVERHAERMKDAADKMTQRSCLAEHPQALGGDAPILDTWLGKMPRGVRPNRLGLQLYPGVEYTGLGKTAGFLCPMGRKPAEQLPNCLRISP